MSKYGQSNGLFYVFSKLSGKFMFPETEEKYIFQKRKEWLQVVVKSFLKSNKKYFVISFFSFLYYNVNYV